MKFKRIFAVAFVLAALWPSMAAADSFILDTGTPPTPSPTKAIPVLNAVDLFQATPGETITQLSAYLTEGAGQPGNTFTWDIYSASGAFLFRSNLREAPSFMTTGAFSADGWNSVDVDWTVPTTGDY